MTSAKTIISPGNLCALAKMVSNAGLQRMMFTENFESGTRQMKALLKKTGVELEAKSSFSEIIEICHDHLLQNYRHEYLYKVALLNSYVLNHYSLVDTILLNEFKIGNSKADTVLVNGTNKVFEIKTELDSPERLNSQLNDYFKAFSEVYIVIHHTAIHKYISLVDEHVGIMLFTADNEIHMLRTAKPYNEKLEIPAMLKAVRKDEYLKIVKTLCGAVPIATPVKMFKACLDALAETPVDKVQAEFLKTIKLRINHLTNEFVQDSSIPSALRFSCYNYNMDRNDYLGLIERLKYQL